MNNILKIFITLFLFIYSFSFSYTYIEKVNEAERLTKKAKNLMDNGEYNKSIEASKEARKVLEFIDKMIPVVKKLNLLEHQINVAKQANVKEHAPKLFAEANKSYLTAYDLLKKNDDIEGSEKEADRGIKLIQDAMAKSQEAINKKRKISKVVKVQKKIDNLSYYVVKLDLKKRDSLWSIAEKKEIYGDPWKWIVIYDANQDQIDDPNLIYPEQKLVIPPVPSKKKLAEIREKLKGVWTQIHR